MNVQEENDEMKAINAMRTLKKDKVTDVNGINGGMLKYKGKIASVNPNSIEV